MTGPEKRFLAIGFLAGALIAQVAGLGIFYRIQRNQAPENKTQALPVNEVAAPVAAMERAVQLSPEEQAKIGIQTEEVRRESLTEDISAIGRVEEQAVNALIELTDLQSVWVKADVFDRDLARIRLGISSTITSDAIPALKVTGKVDFIDPHSDPQTRTTAVRIQVNNPGTRLRPGMIVQAVFHIAMGNVLTVPRDAVIDSGTEKLVYVARNNGMFEQQRIQAGTPLKDRYPVTEGLKSGDRVVTNGVFLVDSQTRLTGGLTGMFGGSRSFSETPLPATSATSAYRLTFRIEPDPPQGARENTIHVSLTDASGKPVPDAQVRLTFTMPAMPAMNMPEMRNDAELKWTGSEYTGPIQIMMAGGWNVGIEARRGNALIATSRAHINAR